MIRNMNRLVTAKERKERKDHANPAGIDFLRSLRSLAVNENGVSA